MISIDDLTRDLGPERTREFREAHDANEAAKAKLAELTLQLDQSRAGQTMNDPTALVGIGANVNELAKGSTLHVAHGAMVAHLENQAIPAAQREVQRTAMILGQLRDGIQRRQAHIDEQRGIIDRAQAEVEKAQAWLDT